MPDMTKSPPELIERFDSIASEFPVAKRRPMFGYPSLTVGGNMVTSLFGSSWVVRLGRDELAEVLALDGAAQFEPMPGRPMTGYALLPAAVVADDAGVRSWVGRAVAYGASLPPKAPKTPKAKAKG